jgi:hypothetical protein
MALSLGGTGGMQMMSQINFRIGTRGVVTGANMMRMQMKNVQTTARRTAVRLAKTTDEIKNVHQAGLQASAALAGAGFGIMQLGKGIKNNFTDPALDGAAAFEVAMERIRFATGATAEEMKMLEGVMVKTGLATTQTPEEAANAFADLRASGLDLNESLEMLPMTIQMVTGSRGLLGMDQAIRLSVSAVKKFQHTGQPFQKTLNDIAQATRETALQWENMPAFFNALRDAPMKMKATSAEMLAMGGVMKSGGMQAAESAQAIAMFADRMILNQRKLRSYLEKKGITEQQFFKMDPKELPKRMIQFQKFGVSMFDAAGKTRPLTEVMVDVLNRMEQLQAKSDEASLTVMSGAFGTKGTSVVNMLSQYRQKGESAADAMDRLVKSVDNSEGVLKKAEDAFLRTTEGLKKLKEGTEDTILIVMGQTILPIYEKFISLTKDALDWFLKFSAENTAFAKALSITATAFGFLAIAVGMAGIAIAGMLLWVHMLAPALAAAGGAAGIFTMVMGTLSSAMLPVLITAGAVVAAFALLYFAFKNWDEIVKVASSNYVLKRVVNFFTSLKLVAQGVVEWWDGKGGPNSMELFKKLDKRGLTNFVGMLIQLKERVVAIFKGILAVAIVLVKAIGLVLGMILTPLGWLIDLLGVVAELFWTDDLENTIDAYKAFGVVIGMLATLFAARYVMSLIKTVAVMYQMIAATTLMTLKAIALKVAIMAAIIVYLMLIAAAVQAGEVIGGWIFDGIEKIKEGVRTLEFYLNRLGEDMVQWLKQGFTNGWSGFIEWVSAQFELLSTTALALFGIKTEEDVQKAFDNAMKGVDINYTPGEQDRETIESGSEFVERREEQRRRISRAAALSRSAAIGEGRTSRDIAPWEQEQRIQEQSVSSPAATQARHFTFNVQGDVTRENAERLANSMWKLSERKQELEFK